MKFSVFLGTLKTFLGMFIHIYIVWLAMLKIQYPVLIDKADSILNPHDKLIRVTVRCLSRWTHCQSNRGVGIRGDEDKLTRLFTLHLMQEDIFSRDSCPGPWQDEYQQILLWLPGRVSYLFPQNKSC